MWWDRYNQHRAWIDQYYVLWCVRSFHLFIGAKVACLEVLLSEISSVPSLAVHITQHTALQLLFMNSASSQVSSCVLICVNIY